MTNYEDRAKKFITTTLASIVHGCRSYNSYVKAIADYNHTHKRHLKWASGYTRITIIRHDYVIKITHRHHSFAGDSATECAGYKMAEEAGYAYLFAKPTMFTYKGRTYEIMPRVHHINDDSKRWYKHLTEEECYWVSRHFEDLHPRNVGYYRNKPVFVDYAYQ